MILNEEQRLIQEMAESFAQETLWPNSQSFEKQGTIPAEVIRQMGQLGLLGMLVPDTYGGAGADIISYALAIEAIAAGDGSCSTMMSVNNSVVCMPILSFGSEQQKQQWLPQLTSGEAIGAFCLTEPNAGSDASQLLTKADKVAGGYRLNGTKQFITSGREAKLAIVFAVTDASLGKKGISAFLVPAETSGYQISKVEHKMGQRASSTAQLLFEDVMLSEAHLLGQEGEGYKIALSNLEGGRIGIAAQSIGMARKAFELALAYGQERQAFGKSINQHQAVGFRLADMATQIEAARALLLHAAELKQAGLPCQQQAAMAKLFASEMAEKVCSAALQNLGGYGYLTEFYIEKLARDVRVAQIYEGTSDILRMVVAKGLI